MARVKELELVDIIGDLPDIIQLNFNENFLKERYDIFFCALGFEERGLIIPERLADVKDFKCKQAFYFEYSTNIKDNEINKQGLINAFEKFAGSWDSIPCDAEEFTKRLREVLKQAITISQQKVRAIFDISVCSSKLLLSTMKVLLEFDINLRVVYSEAKTYHPTPDEFEKEPEKWMTEENFGIARGVGEVIPSSEHPGAKKENPNLIVAFLTFKPERTNAIITDIDETLSIRPDKRRIIYIVGDPHMDEENKRRRKEIMRKINKILPDFRTHDVSTFDYKETLKALDKIYNDKNLDFHINISALGSKMQSLGIAIFCHIRPEISVYLAIPKKFNPKQYTEGCEATWQIDFGDLKNIKSILNKVGQLEIVKEL